MGEVERLKTVSLVALDNHIDEVETEGFSQAETPEGAVPPMARPAKKADIANRQQDKQGRWLR